MAKFWISLCEVNSKEFVIAAISDVVMAGARLLDRQDSPRERRCDFQIEVPDAEAVGFWFKYRERRTCRGVLEMLLPSDPLVEFLSLARAEANADLDGQLPDYT